MSYTLRNAIAFLFILVSLGCLYPGLTEPMLQIQIATDLPFVGRIEVFNQVQSVVESIQSLYKGDNILVAFLILLFSVLVPVLKAAILITVLAFPKFKYRSMMYQAVAVIGKWSMADVFVVATFMAYLAAGSHSAVSASLHPGFYFFTGYCVISLLGIQLMSISSPDQRDMVSEAGV